MSRVSSPADRERFLQVGFTTWPQYAMPGSDLVSGAAVVPLALGGGADPVWVTTVLAMIEREVRSSKRGPRSAWLGAEGMCGFAFTEEAPGRTSAKESWRKQHAHSGGDARLEPIALGGGGGGGGGGSSALGEGRVVEGKERREGDGGGGERKGGGKSAVSAVSRERKAGDGKREREKEEGGGGGTSRGERAQRGDSSSTGRTASRESKEEEEKKNGGLDERGLVLLEEQLRKAGGSEEVIQVRD
eukprot:339661-Rhodomonas_salina.1